MFSFARVDYVVVCSLYRARRLEELSVSRERAPLLPPKYSEYECYARTRYFHEAAPPVPYLSPNRPTLLRRHDGSPVSPSLCRYNHSATRAVGSESVLFWRAGAARVTGKSACCFRISRRAHHTPGPYYTYPARHAYRTVDRACSTVNNNERYVINTAGRGRK